MIVEKNYLLPAHVQRELGLVMLNVPESHRYIGRKVLITLAPTCMQRQDAGEVSVNLEVDPMLTEFFSSDAVCNVCGGAQGMKNWLISTGHSRCHLHDKEYCHPEITWWESDAGALSVCWYHDPCTRTNEINAAYIAQVTEKMLNIRREYVVFKIRAGMGISDRPMSLYELMWFAVSHSVHEHLPPKMLAKVAGYVEKPIPVVKLGDKPDYYSRFLTEPTESDYAESKIAEIQRSHTAAASVIHKVPKPVLVDETPPEPVEKAVKTLDADDAPPASFMLKPKRIRWQCEKYTRWVKCQPCVCCGAQADDPHHLIGHSQGGMATKAHDIFTFPLCRQHHDQLHRDPRSWEAQHGSQVRHVLRTIDKAFALGVLS